MLRKASDAAKEVHLSRLSQRARWAAGQPISILMHKALANPELISLAAGFVDNETLPTDAAGEAATALFADPVAARHALQYGTTHGLLPLRESLLADLQAADGTPQANVSADQVLVTAGSNELLHLLADTLTEPGDIVLCAAPTYFVFLGILRNLGVRSIGVAADADGVLPEALDEELRRLEVVGDLGRVKAIYLVSYFDNPGGSTISAARRPAIVELAKKWSKHGTIYVIEDAAYRELRYDGADVPSLRSFDAEGDTVVYAQTFSKSFSPGVRVGWGVLPPQLVGPLFDQKGNVDFGSPNLAQHLVYTAIQRGLIQPQIDRLRAGYRPKREAMLAALDKHFAGVPNVHWRIPRGGLYVWLTLPAEIETGPSGRLLDLAADRGVLYVPGEYCFPGEGVPLGRSSMRLSFGVQSADRIALGIQALAEAVKEVG